MELRSRIKVRFVTPKELPAAVASTRRQVVVFYHRLSEINGVPDGRTYLPGDTSAISAFAEKEFQVLFVHSRSVTGWKVKAQTFEVEVIFIKGGWSSPEIDQGISCIDRPRKGA